MNTIDDADLLNYSMDYSPLDDLLHYPSHFWKIDPVAFTKAVAKHNDNIRPRSKLQSDSEWININTPNDPVNHPSHYTNGSVECIDAIKSALTPEEFHGYLRGNIIKYLWRCELKNNTAEDLKKARWYLDKLISSIEDEMSEE